MQREATWWVCGNHDHELELSRAGGSGWNLRWLDRGSPRWSREFPDERAAREAAGEIMAGHCCPEHACGDWWCLLNHGIIML